MKHCLLAILVLTLLVGCATTGGSAGRRGSRSATARLPASARDFLQQLAGSYYLNNGDGSYDEYTIRPDSTYSETQHSAALLGSPAQTTTRTGPVHVLADDHFEMVFPSGSLEFVAAPDFASFAEDNGTTYVRK